MNVYSSTLEGKYRVIGHALIAADNQEIATAILKDHEWNYSVGEIDKDKDPAAVWTNPEIHVKLTSNSLVPEIVYKVEYYED